MVRKLGLYLALCSWVGLSITGMVGMAHYASSPGKGAEAPIDWPAELPIELSSSRPTLLMLVHPQCSCSRASLNELERIIAKTGGANGVRVLIVFYAPESKDVKWVEGDLWKKAASLPGAQLVKDTDGSLINSFGTFTSGQTMLYNTAGALLFSGGVTGSRAHEGDNDGQQAIMDLLQENKPETQETFVFGCSIIDRVQSVFSFLSI